MEHPVESSSNFRNSSDETEDKTTSNVNSDKTQRKLSMLKLLRTQKSSKSLVNEAKTGLVIVDVKSDEKSTKDDEDEDNKALKKKLLDCLEIVACEYGANSEEVVKKDDHGEEYRTTKNAPESPKKRTSNTISCPLCGEAFPNSSTIKSHDCVNSEKPHKCDECSKSFSRNYSLVLHKRIHSGEKPYTCEYCLKSFSVSHNLILHKRSHTGERPYTCDVCQKTFSQRHHLNVHKWIHRGDKPFKCDECSKSYSQIFYLTRHQRTHTGEKPYGCDECSKRFSQRYHLNIHKRVHTGTRPFQCAECSKCFTQLSHLKQHFKTHVD